MHPIIRRSTSRSCLLLGCLLVGVPAVAEEPGSGLLAYCRQKSDDMYQQSQYMKASNSSSGTKMGGSYAGYGANFGQSSNRSQQEQRFDSMQKEYQERDCDNVLKSYYDNKSVQRAAEAAETVASIQSQAAVGIARIQAGRDMGMADTQLQGVRDTNRTGLLGLQNTNASSIRINEIQSATAMHQSNNLLRAVFDSNRTAGNIAVDTNRTNYAMNADNNRTNYAMNADNNRTGLAMNTDNNSTLRFISNNQLKAANNDSNNRLEAVRDTNNANVTMNRDANRSWLSGIKSTNNTNVIQTGIQHGLGFFGGLFSNNARRKELELAASLEREKLAAAERIEYARLNVNAGQSSGSINASQATPATAMKICSTKESSAQGIPVRSKPSLADEYINGFIQAGAVVKATNIVFVGGSGESSLLRMLESGGWVSNSNLCSI